MKKAFKIIRRVVNIAITVLVVMFVVVVCMQRFSNNRLSFFNYRMFTVITGSMEPRYKIGDVLIAKDVDPKEVKVGDAISYLGKNGQLLDKVITHEVVEITTDSEGKIIFHTKGLVNLVEDPMVHEDQLYGVVKRKAVLLSFVYSVVRTPFGMFIFVAIPIMYIIGSEVLTFMINKEEARRGISKKEEDEEEEDELPKKKATTSSKKKVESKKTSKSKS